MGRSRGGEGAMSTAAERGQSTLEYILVLAAILVAVIAAANGVIGVGVGKAMGDATTTMTAATGHLVSQFAPQ